MKVIYEFRRKLCTSSNLQKVKVFSCLHSDKKKSLAVVHLNPNPITLTLEGCSLRGNKITH